MATSDERIQASTLEIVRTRGPLAVTIESVAAHSGVARTTIYRRYRDREEMLAGALQSLTAPPALGAHGSGAPSGAERLRWAIANAAHIVVSGIGFGGLAALITDADETFGHVFRDALGGHHSVLFQAIHEGVQEGSLRPDLDEETLIDAIVGALVSEYARNGAISDDWESRLLALFLPVTVPTVPAATATAEIVDTRQRPSAAGHS